MAVIWINRVAPVVGFPRLLHDFGSLVEWHLAMSGATSSQSLRSCHVSGGPR